MSCGAIDVRRLRAAVVAAASLAGACSSADLARGTSIARDSAGVRIIENSAPVSSTAPFTIDTAPLIDLGGAAGGPSQEFSGFVFPVRLSDGRLIIANGGSQELRTFDSTGRPLKPIGRGGDGPGEFRSLGWLRAGAGDTLRTYDWNTRLVSVFSPDGAFRRSFRMTPPAAALSLRPVGILEDGRLIFQTQSRMGVNARAGVHRDTVMVLVFNANGEVTDSVGRYLGSEVWVEREENSVSLSPLPFGKDMMAVAHRSSVFVGTGDRAQVDVRTSDGRLLRIIRWPVEPVPITPAVIDAYITYTMRDWTPESESDRARYIASVKAAPIPKTKPAFGDLLVSSDGWLWVRNYNEPDYDAPPTFEVFDADGVWQGAVQMPAWFSPTHITTDFVLGIWRDDDHVQHVRMYRLTRPR